jgi:hypothetical protein
VHPAFAQPGHWLGPVTGPGWLGLAQPTWDELGPPPKKIYACIKKINLFYWFIHLGKSRE